MVDAVVSYAVQKLGDFLIQKVALRQKVKDDVQWMKIELQYMQSFLKDAEQKQTMDHLVRQWMSEITDLAHDIVDILDEFYVKVGSGGVSKNGVANCVKRYACLCYKEAYLYDIGNDLESLRKRVLDLSRKRDTYDIPSISNIVREGSSSNGPIIKTKIKELRRTTSYIKEEHFVGFEDVTKILMKELLKDEDRRSVISIHGMGGLGKTTLARKLYNSKTVQIRFACRAWVCVSQEYSVQDLLRTVIKSFKRGCNREELERLERLNEEDLERYLHEFLNKQMYLVVVDDVWHKEAWESLKRAFPDSHNGSRVIITTRIKEVAERVDDRSFVHHLRFLRPAESWDLFRKKIFGRDERAQRFPPEMQAMGEEMVGKCGGLPLAIVVLGGLLSTKKSPEQWRKMKDQLWHHLKNDSIDISHLLSLSYNDLSSELKQCFLYVGIFPEDYLIWAEKLMWLWMAEGFIPQGNMMESTAEDYLQELINRSLIQVADRFLGRIGTCKIHDLLRDLAIEKVREVKLFDIYDQRVHEGAHSCRRLTIHTQIEKFFPVGISSAKLRSLLYFNPHRKHPHTKHLKIICEKFKFLCVLELGNVSFGNNLDGCRLPDAIGDLIHLKFLGLMRTNFTLIPSTIGNLKSLQSLQISSNDKTGYALPTEISKLINLRHLVVKGSQGHLKIDTLANLRTLIGLSLSQWMDIDTANLVNLRELSVDGAWFTFTASYSLDSVINLKSLTTLTLQSYEDTLPSLEPLYFCSNLLRLVVKGKLNKLPLSDKVPQSLTVLKLKNSQLFEDPMPILENLLNLGSLVLESNAYYGKEITCSDNGFLQLEHLILWDLPNLENWILTDTAMPVIKSVNIIKCPKLKTIPKRLKSITSESPRDLTQDLFGNDISVMS